MVLAAAEEAAALDSGMALALILPFFSSAAAEEAKALDSGMALALILPFFSSAATGSFCSSGAFPFCLAAAGRGRGRRNPK